MGFLSVLFFILSLRTNVVFVVIFLSLIAAFGLFTGAYWNIALGNMDIANRCVIVSVPLLSIHPLLGGHGNSSLTLVSCCRPPVPSSSSPLPQDGGSGSPSCWPCSTSPSSSPLETSPPSSRARASVRRLRRPTIWHKLSGWTRGLYTVKQG
jgi:hypothetical protein